MEVKEEEGWEDRAMSVEGGKMGEGRDVAGGRIGEGERTGDGVFIVKNKNW